MLVPLSRDLYMSFYGEPPPFRIKGLALVEEVPLAVGGIGFRDGWLYVFMDMVSGAEKYPKQLVRGGKEVIRMARQYNLPIVASRDEELETSERFLSRLGFVQDGDVWRIE